MPFSRKKHEQKIGLKCNVDGQYTDFGETPKLVVGQPLISFVPSGKGHERKVNEQPLISFVPSGKGHERKVYSTSATTNNSRAVTVGNLYLEIKAENDDFRII